MFENTMMKIAQDAVKKMDFQKLATEAIKKVDVPALLKMVIDAFKQEAELLNKDNDGNGKIDLQENLADLKIIEEAGDRIVKRLKLAHEKAPKK